MENRTFKYEAERKDHMQHYKQVFDNIFERRELKCCAVLMKHCRKVKGEQVTSDHSPNGSAIKNKKY